MANKGTASAPKTRRNSTSRSTKPASTKTRVTKQTYTQPSWSERLRLVLQDPQRWQSYLPSWWDEAGAFAFIIFGVLTLSALFNPSGEIAAPLAHGLKSAFGGGAFLVAFAIIALGIIMLLPKVGLNIKLNWVRILAIELTFLCLQGLFHLLAFDPETRALAREGKGGGYVGWAISSLLASILGTWGAIIVLGIGSMISIGIVLGIQRHEVRGFLLSLVHFLQDFASRLRPDEWNTEVVAVAAPPKKTEIITPITSAAGLPSSSVSTPISPSVSVEEAPPPLASADTTPVAPNQLRADTIVINGQQITPPPVVLPPVLPVSSPSSEPSPTPPPPPLAQNATTLQDSVPKNKEVVEEEIEDEANDIDLGELRQFNTLIINGQVVQNNGDRPTLVPHEVEQTKSLAKRPKHVVTGHARRYFVVEGYQDKIKVGKRSTELPPLELLSYTDLKLPSEIEVNQNAETIENTMREFEIDADVIDVRIGPSITQYAVSPIKEIINENGERVVIRTRVSKISALANDLALALSTKTLRIEAPVPGHSYVGIEVPNREPSVVALRSVLETEVFYKERKRPLAVPLGRDVSGDPVVIDLATMPHMLVAGTTGSGKSVFLRSLITSLVMNNTSDQLRMVILDPKMVEFTQFNGLPHLVGPVETDLERIIGVLRWATREMDRRYKLLELEKARNIESYNEILGRRRRHEHMPYIVIVIDEIGDLMMTLPDETENTLTRLAQKARACGMHLVVATQRPSVDVITGLIKANFPARVSFAVAAGVDSRVILDTVGAEALIGKGDMLFLGPDAAGPKRVQGCYVTDEDVTNVVGYWRTWYEAKMESGEMEKPDIAPWEAAMTRLESLSQLDPVLEEALNLVVMEGRASVSLIQRRLGIGYPRAARLLDSLYELSIIGSPKAGGQTREVLVKSVEEARRMVHNNRRKKFY